MDRDQFRSAAAPFLEMLFPDSYAEALTRLLDVVDQSVATSHQRLEPLDERTTVLITYGDSIQHPGEVPLVTLQRVLEEQAREVFSHVHLLPMFPFTSDDGFAVVDYRKINPALGDWEDVESLRPDYGLMFDFVANHVSSECPWFLDWLAGGERYQGYFVEQDPNFDTSIVTRPRTSPLFHSYPRSEGSPAVVWTTFSRDQIDVNFADIPALIEMTQILLEYLARGASMIRLDAIGFLWKESGTTCMHLPQTHAVVKLWRLVVDYVTPGAQIITETNVPTKDNISYFGNGSDEAHQVYNFPVPPLVLHTFVTQDTTVLNGWIETIEPVSQTATFFNFLASHDGIGLRGSEGLLTDDQRQVLAQRVLDNGGRASMKTNPDGSESVYELNIDYQDALATKAELSDPEKVAAKGLAAHSMMFSMIGVPAVYIHSLFGSSSDYAGMEASGINRRINRAVLDADALGEELATNVRRRLMRDGISHLLAVRGRHPAFSPYQPAKVERLDPRVFALRRGTGTADDVLCLANVSDETVELPQVSGVDVLTNQKHAPVTLPPYGYAWIS